MVTLHSFDDEPHVEPDEVINIHVISRDFEERFVIECFSHGGYMPENKSILFDWDEIADFWRESSEGWLYESELMQCVKNWTRSE